MQLRCWIVKSPISMWVVKSHEQKVIIGEDFPQLFASYFRVKHMKAWITFQHWWLKFGLRIIKTKLVPRQKYCFSSFYKEKCINSLLKLYKLQKTQILIPLALILVYKKDGHSFFLNSIMNNSVDLLQFEFHKIMFFFSGSQSKTIKTWKTMYLLHVLWVRMAHGTVPYFPIHLFNLFLS